MCYNIELNPQVKNKLSIICTRCVGFTSIKKEETILDAAAQPINPFTRIKHLVTGWAASLCQTLPPVIQPLASYIKLFVENEQLR